MRYLLIMCLLYGSVFSTFAQEETSTSPEDYIFDFPPPMFTNEQYEAVLECDFTDISTELEFDTDADSCTLAQFAVMTSQTTNRDGDLPDEAYNAYHLAVEDNPAIAYQIDVYYAFANGARNLVSTPNFEQDLTSVIIDYSFVGGQTNYTLVMLPDEDNENVFTVTGNVYHETFSQEEPEEYEVDTSINIDLMTALPASLVNLMPINNQYTDQPCWHIISDWNITLTFEDESNIVMQTNQSNLFSIGGPYQTTINGQDYLQIDNAFIISVIDILIDLELPTGEVMSYGCSEAIGPAGGFRDELGE
ncbi:MAG: hypothetical protein Phog2KO_30680 [Phototrophicaceae bacterium]